MNWNRSQQVLVFFCTFILISIIVIPQPTLGQLNDKWKKTYGGTSNDVARSVIFSDDGGILMAGYTRSFGEGKLNNFHLVKTNLNGYTKWRRTYGGQYDDEAEDIIQTDDGELVMVGSSESYSNRPEERAQYNFYLLNLDPEGKKNWDSVFGGRYDERCYSVVQTEDGYLMGGSTITFGDRGEDFWVVKTDEKGNMVWNETYGGGGDDICRSVTKTDDGNYLLAGHTDSFGDPGQGAYLVKIDKTGEMIWNRSVGGSFDDFVYDVIAAENGGYVYVGSTTSYGAGEESFWMVKTDPKGREVWNYSSDGDFDEVAYSVEQSKDGNFLMTGYTSSYGPDGKNFWIVEIDQEGEEVNKKTFGANGDEVAYSIAISEDDDICIAGYTRSYGAGGEDFWAIRLGRPREIPLYWMVAGVAGVVSLVVAGYVINKRYRFV